MGFIEVLASFISSPKRLYTSIRDTVLPSPKKRKRSLEDSTLAQLEGLQPESSRLKVSGQRQAEGATEEAETIPPAILGVREIEGPIHVPRSSLAAQLTAQGTGQPFQQFQGLPQCPYLFSPSPRIQAAYEAGRYGTQKPAAANPAVLDRSAAGRPQLYTSVTPRRHGPHNSFRSGLAPKNSAQAAPSSLLVSSDGYVVVGFQCGTRFCACRKVPGCVMSDVAACHALIFMAEFSAHGKS
jgi:hypothetical protein